MLIEIILSSLLNILEQIEAIFTLSKLILEVMNIIDEDVVV